MIMHPSEDPKPYDDSNLPEGAEVNWIPGAAVGGSVIASILSSACCWIPLLYLLFSTRAREIAMFFEHNRWIFMAIAGLLLIVGFYQVYFRKACCTSTSDRPFCRRLRVFNIASLWLGSALAIASATLPDYYFEELINAVEKHNPPAVMPAPSSAAITTISLDIEGMTCAGCAATIKHSLLDVEGVMRANVSFRTGKADISITEQTDLPALLRVIEQVGFSASLPRAQLASNKPGILTRN